MPSDFHPAAIHVKSAYEKPALSDGVRILVEAKCPEDLDRDAARIDLWLPALAASESLAKWLTQHKLAGALERKYFNELKTPKATAALEQIYNHLLQDKTVTLLYAVEDEVLNNAVLLKGLLDGNRKPPNGTGPAKAAAAGGRVRA